VIAIAPIEYFPLIEHDRLAQAVGLDVGDQSVELPALHQREDVGERVEFEGGVGHDTRRRADASSPLQYASRRARDATHRPPTFRAGIAPLSNK
jgi:hypothetical protein